jgi:hypothetical protein
VLPRFNAVLTSSSPTFPLTRSDRPEKLGGRYILAVAAVEHSPALRIKRRGIRTVRSGYPTMGSGVGNLTNRARGVTDQNLVVCCTHGL